VILHVLTQLDVVRETSWIWSATLCPFSPTCVCKHVKLLHAGCHERVVRI